MSHVQSSCPIRFICNEANRLAQAHAEACLSDNPPRVSEWRAAEPEREQRIRELRALATDALARGVASGLSATEIVACVDELLGSVTTLLRWLPDRCKFGMGVGSDALDGVDMASAPLPEMPAWEVETSDTDALEKEQQRAKAQLRAQAVEWREQDDKQLASLRATFESAVDRCQQVAALADMCVAPAQECALPSELPKHADGPEAGRFLWWDGVQHDIPAGVIYRLIAYFWQRAYAKYDDLMGVPGPERVWDSEVVPQTVRSKTSAANKVLSRIGVPWRFSVDSEALVVRKVPCKNP